MGLISAVAGNALPFGARYWRQILLLLVFAAVAATIAMLNHQLKTRTGELKVANDTMIKMTVQYKNDVEHLKTSVDTQNAAISIYAQKTKDAETKIATAATESNIIRAKTDKQVMTILNRPKEVTCEKSISSLIVGVSELQWSAIK